MKHHIEKPAPRGVLNSALLALLLGGGSAGAQSVTIDNILAPGSPLSITGLNSNGQVAGYYFDSEAAQRAFRWSNGTALDFGTLGGSFSIGNALNNAGAVAGFSATDNDAEFHAFLSTGSGISDFGTLGGLVSVATAVSDLGHVVGQSSLSPDGPEFHAFIVTSGRPIRDLGTLGGSSSSAKRVNNSGQVIGDSSIAGDAAAHAFLYSAGAMRDLGTLGGSFSSAFALNERGQVAGESTVAGELTHAFLFDGNAMLDLGTLGGSFSTATGLNNSGHVIGNSALANEVDSHGFVYRNGVLQDLGTLGGASSAAHAINNRGQVVGASTDASSQQRAFLWENNRMTDLNRRLPADSGWELTSARFINDNSQVVGEGLYQGQVAWYLLTLGAAAENHPPVAAAGDDQVLSCTKVAHLDGSASSDPDGDALTFEWSKEGVSLGATAVIVVELPLGSHTLTLRVTDPSGSSSEDSVVVLVQADDTMPPAVECPAAQTLPANARGRAQVPDFLATLVATDNCTATSALVKKQSPAPGAMVKCGNHTVTITVVDAAGNVTTCSTAFSVVDVTSPVVRCPEDIYRRARAGCQVVVPDLTVRLGASDNCTPKDQLVITQEPAAGTPVGLGSHEVRMTVTDAAGNTTACSVLMHVVDVVVPVVRSISASPNVLQPADGRMVPVTLSVVATDNCDPQPVSRIVAVASTEPGTGLNDSTSPDWEITGDLTVNLRAENSSRRTPRVYLLLVAVSDASGNTSFRVTHVKVPRSLAQ